MHQKLKVLPVNTVLELFRDTGEISQLVRTVDFEPLALKRPQF